MLYYEIYSVKLQNKENKMYILKFEDITLKDKDSVGAKAFNLSSISDLGLNIPKGFCIKSNMLIKSV
jgi:phosphoenolpyruvate synthase/pyruvate phosphate dikinase